VTLAIRSHKKHRHCNSQFASMKMFITAIGTAYSCLLCEWRDKWVFSNRESRLTISSRSITFAIILSFVLQFDDNIIVISKAHMCDFSSFWCTSVHSIHLSRRCFKRNCELLTLSNFLRRPVHYFGVNFTDNREDKLELRDIVSLINQCPLSHCIISPIDLSMG